MNRSPCRWFSLRAGIGITSHSAHPRAPIGSHIQNVSVDPIQLSAGLSVRKSVLNPTRFSRMAIGDCVPSWDTILGSDGGLPCRLDRPSVLCGVQCRITTWASNHKFFVSYGNIFGLKRCKKDSIPDGRPTTSRRSGKSVLLPSADLQSSRPATPACGHSAKYPWLRGSMPAKQLHSSSFPFGYEPRCRSSASSAWSAGARSQHRSHGIKYSNTLFRASRRWSI